MTEPLSIAIIGSVREEIVGSAQAVDEGRKMAQRIGAALAQAGLKIVVYSSDPDFVEADVVRGYASAAPDASGMIEIVHPFDEPVDRRFAEEATHERLFVRKRDDSEYWEASFYDSLAKVDGAFLIGGGQSTIVAGHVALNSSLPIIAASAFRGSAEKIWRAMRVHKDYRDNPALDLMHERTAAAAEGMVKALKEIGDKRREAQERLRLDAAELKRFQEQRRRLPVGWASLLVFFAILVAGLIRSEGGDWFTIIFFATLITGGVAGAAIRLLWQKPSGASVGAKALYGALSGFVIGAG